MTRHRAFSTVRFCLFLGLCSLLLFGIAYRTAERARPAAAANLPLRAADSNEGRGALLAALGLEASPVPVEVTEVQLPHRFDAVYEAYNELQKPLGLDLSLYRGCTARRYTYVLENYPAEGTVYANLLFCEGAFVGGDVSSAAQGLFQVSLACML